MFTKRGSRFQFGTTLIELIVFIIVVSVGLTGVLSVFNLVARSSADPLIAKQALAVADAMMEEILLKDFSDPGGPAETSRQDWDNVDDYHGYATTNIFSLFDLVTPVLAGYDLNVTVAAPSGLIGGVAAADIRQITVTVTHGAETYTLTGYRFNYD